MPIVLYKQTTNVYIYTYSIPKLGLMNDKVIYKCVPSSFVIDLMAKVEVLSYGSFMVLSRGI